MTALTEAKLAREAEMASAVVGLVTDYDCWRVEEEAVSVDAVMAVLKQNGDNVQVWRRKAHTWGTSGAVVGLICSAVLLFFDWSFF